jgi:hypothetical protein
MVSFDHYFSSIWRSINLTRGMRGSAQYDAAFTVVAETEHELNTIVKQCGPFVNPKTRLNGLSVLRRSARLSRSLPMTHCVTRYRRILEAKATW